LDSLPSKPDVAARIANDARKNLAGVEVTSVGPVDSVGLDAQFINNLRVRPRINCPIV